MYVVYLILLQAPTVIPLTTAAITGWIVQYKRQDGSMSQTDHVFTVNITDPSQLYFILSNLSAGVMYSARVAGDTAMGVGPFSQYYSASTELLCEWL